MELRVVVAAAGAEHEVAVTLQPGHTVADLSAALAHHIGAAPRALFVDTPAGSRELDDDAPVLSAGVASGATLRWARREPVVPDWEVVVVGGPDAGRVLPVPPGGGVLGRSNDVDLVVSDPFVSRRHLSLQPDGERLLVTDLGSANGTRVGGTPIEPGHAAGDEPLELGSTLVQVRRHRRPRDPVARDVTSTLLAAEDLAAAVRSATGGTTDPVRADRLVDAVASRSVPIWTGRAGAALPLRVGWTHDAADAPTGLDVDVASGPTLVRGGAATAVARSLVVQAAALYPPAELAVRVLVSSDRAPDWAWLHWLPGAGPGALLVGAGEALAGLRQQGPATGRLLVVVDLGLANATRLVELAAGMDHAIVVGIGGGVGGEDDDADGPWSQDIAIDPAGAVTVVASEGTRNGVGADGMEPDVARGLARRLAGMQPPAAAVDAPTSRRAPLPDAVWASDADSIAVTWAARRPRMAVVGVAADGPAGLDVVDAGRTAVVGPPAVAADVLATMVASLATGVGPDRVTLAVLDPGGRLAVAGELPHVVEVARDPADLLARLRTERERRQSLLDASGADDWEAWRARGDVLPSPMVVVGAEGTAATLDEALAGAEALGMVRVVAAPGAGGGGAVVRVDEDGTAILVRPDGSSVQVVVPVRAAVEDDDASISVDDLVHGRPSLTQGHTSLQRRAPVRDHLADVVAACVDGARSAGLGRATWSPAAEAFEHGRVRRTFVFTDIVGSTALVEVIGDAAWTDLVTWHDRALREAFDAHDGEEVDHAGDGFLVAFEDPGDAVACSVAIQRRLAEHRATAGFAPRVRIGGHTTEVIRSEGYRGHGLHLAARVGSLADGDQVVFSATTVDQVQPRPLTVNSRMVEVKGSSAPIEVLEVDWR